MIRRRAMMGAIAAVTLLAGCGSNSEPAAKPTPTASARPFTVTGTVFINASDTTSTQNFKTIGSDCFGTNEFDDVTGNTAITVDDDSKKRVALGRFTGSTASSTVCELTFSISGVPADSKFYDVRVGSREPRSFTKSELQKPLTIPLN